jgi:hypothetical protein
MIEQALPAAVQRNAAFPGAILMLAGAFLIVWALSQWGVFGSSSNEQ